MRDSSLMAFTCALLLASAVAAAPLPIAALNRKTPVDFPSEVYPVLKSNCIACHNKTTTKGGLNMETPELMKKGGDTGTAIEPGKGKDSLLLQSAAHDADSDMPPKGNKVGAVNLSPEELGLIKLWIDQGAKPGQKRVQQIAWQPLPAGLNPIYAVAMAPGGDTAACSRANQVFVYDLATRQQAAQFVAHRDMTLALAFSPDGSRLASGSFGEVKIWKREAAKLPLSPAVKTLMDNEAKVQQGTRTAALADLDVTYLTTSIAAATADVTANKDRLKKAGDAVTDTKAKLEEKRKALKPAADAKAAALKALAEADALAAKDPKIEPALITWQAAAKAALDAATKIESLAVAAAKANPGTGPDAEKRTKAVQAAKDAKVAAQKAMAEVDDLVAKAPKDKPDAALAKAQTAAKTKLDAATKADADASEAVKVAETAATDAAAELPKVTKLQAEAVKTEADAKAALAAAQVKQKKLAADLAAATKQMTDAAKTAATLVLSADHRWLLEPQADGSSVVWAMNAGLPVAKFVPKANAKPALAWKPDGQLSWAADSGTLEVKDLTPKWTLERTLGTGDAASVITDRVNALSFSPDGKTLAVGSGAPSRGGDITLWEVGTGKLAQAIRDRHSDAVLSLDFSADGKLIASGGADKQLRVSEVTSGKLLKTFEGHTHHVMGVSWRADGRVIASSGADNAVKIWDWIKGERRKSLDGWDKEVTSLHYLGTSTRLVTTAGDKQVRTIGEDASGPVALTGTTDFMQSCSVSSSGQWVAAGGEDSVLRVWETKSGAALGAFAKP